MYYWISQGLVLVLVIVSILHVHLGAERRSTEEATDSAPMGVIRARIIVCGVVLMGLNVATATRIDERLDTQLAEFQDQLGRLQSQVGRIDASVSSLDVLRSSEAAELEQLESVSKQQRQLVDNLNGAIRETRTVATELNLFTPVLRSVAAGRVQEDAPPSRLSSTSTGHIRISTSSSGLMTVEEKKINDDLAACKNQRDKLLLDKEEASASFKAAMRGNMPADSVMRINRDFRDFVEDAEERIQRLDRKINSLRLQLGRLQER